MVWERMEDREMFVVVTQVVNGKRLAMRFGDIKLVSDGVDNMPEGGEVLHSRC
jgi:hypothetical protein